MKHRKHLGNLNMVGANIEKLRKLKNIKQKDFIAQMQICGVDINPSSFSKLEGQIRIATDIEVYYAAKILGVKIEELFKEYELNQ